MYCFSGLRSRCCCQRRSRSSSPSRLSHLRPWLSGGRSDKWYGTRQAKFQMRWIVIKGSVRAPLELSLSSEGCQYSCSGSFVSWQHLWKEWIWRTHNHPPSLPQPSEGQSVDCHRPAPVTESGTHERLKLSGHLPICYFLLFVFFFVIFLFVCYYFGIFYFLFVCFLFVCFLFVCFLFVCLLFVCLFVCLFVQLTAATMVAGIPALLGSNRCNTSTAGWGRHCGAFWWLLYLYLTEFWSCDINFNYQSCQHVELGQRKCEVRLTGEGILVGLGRNPDLKVSWDILQIDPASKRLVAC